VNAVRATFEATNRCWIPDHALLDDLELESQRFFICFYEGTVDYYRETKRNTTQCPAQTPTLRSLRACLYVRRTRWRGDGENATRTRTPARAHAHAHVHKLTADICSRLVVEAFFSKGSRLFRAPLMLVGGGGGSELFASAARFQSACLVPRLELPRRSRVHFALLKENRSVSSLLPQLLRAIVGVSFAPPRGPADEAAPVFCVDDVIGRETVSIDLTKTSASPPPRLPVSGKNTRLAVCTNVVCLCACRG